MRRTTAAIVFSACSAFGGCTRTGPQDPFLVVSNGQLAPNIALAVDTSEHQRDWVTVDNAGKHLDLAYPAGQTWGLVQFWLGLDLSGARPTEDFSEFNTLQLLLDGTWLDEAATVSVGIQSGSEPLPDQLLLEPILAKLPPHRADQGATYYQIDLGEFDPSNAPSPRAKLASPAGLYFSGVCGGLVQIYEVSLFKDFVSCCASICTKGK